MIFRVTQTTDRSGVVVNIDGQLVGDFVPVAEECCLQALSGGTRVSVFLRDVSAVDEAGLNLLRRLSDQGIRLLASGVYNSSLIERIQCQHRAYRPTRAVSPRADDTAKGAR